MYSKEVMEHFRNPKNVGKIRNADGVGEVGNIICGDKMHLYIKVGKNGKEEIIKDVKFETFGCLPSDEEVLVKEGEWIKISDISKGDVVLNSNGIKTKVLESYIRKYSGKLLTFVPFVSSFNKFSVTPEHPILSIKRKNMKHRRKSSKLCEWFRVDEQELLSTKPKFIDAIDLEVGDYLVFVPNCAIKDSKEFTYELMRLIGYYLSEGYIVASGGALVFSLNKNEAANISELRELISKITNRQPKHRIRKNVIEIYICSRKWAKFFVSLCGKIAKHKKISDQLLMLPFEKQWQMIETYIKGDGSLYRRRENDSETYRVSTASRCLAIQMQEILARGGIFASIKKSNQNRNFIEGRRVNAGDIYEVSFKLEKKHCFVRYNKNKKYLLVPIKIIKQEDYNGNVYNFHVDGKPESYLVKGFGVHNCVAAIATSSIITEMAKGKKLLEAADIKKDDIVKALGGLPAVKVHCSVLAVDALTEAIYDYFVKNKKTVPAALKKKHERILQEKNIVEEKYKDWTDNQSRMLKKK